MKTKRSFYGEVFLFALVASIFFLEGSLPVRTAHAQEANSFCFVITGDRCGNNINDQINTEVFKQVMEQAADTTCNIGMDGKKPDFLVFDGDLIFGKLDIGETIGQFSAWKTAASADSSGFDESKILMAWGGNHDGNTPIGGDPKSIWEAWRQSFDPKNKFELESDSLGASCEYPDGGAGENFGHTVYFCEVQNAGFFILNNNKDPVDDQEIADKTVNGEAFNQLSWLQNTIADKNQAINFFIHQIPIYTLFKTGMSSKPAKLNEYLKKIVSAQRPIVLSADEHNYHRRRLNDSLNPELAEMEFFELKIGPAGAPVRNQALLAGNFRKNVEFFRAPERFGPKNNEQYVLGLEHYFGVVSVDNSSDSPTVSVDVYAVVFSSDGTSFVEKNLIDRFQAYPVPQPPTQLIQPSDPAWRYFLGTTSPQGWKEVGYDDSTWQTACIGGEKSGIGPATNRMALWRTGIGYGDNDDCTVIPTSSDGNYDSVYTRLKFDLEDPSEIKQMILSLDFDDGFVAYINFFACSLAAI